MSCVLGVHFVIEFADCLPRWWMTSYLVCSPSIFLNLPRMHACTIINNDRFWKGNFILTLHRYKVSFILYTAGIAPYKKLYWNDDMHLQCEKSIRFLSTNGRACNYWLGNPCGAASMKKVGLSILNYPLLKHSDFPRTKRKVEQETHTHTLYASTSLLLSWLSKYGNDACNVTHISGKENKQCFSARSEYSIFNSIVCLIKVIMGINSVGNFYEYCTGFTAQPPFND